MSLTPLIPARRLRFDLVAYKAWSSLYSETVRSRLGFIWWVLDPILYMAVFYVVFAVIFERGGEDFVVKLLIALVLWRWFDNAVKAAGSSLVVGVGLMQQVYVSKFLFPLSALLAQSIKSLVVLAILLLFLLIYGLEPSFGWLRLLPVLIVQLVFTSALGLLLAGLIPFFPDLKVLVDYGLQLAFFLSGVFFEISQVPEHVQPWFALNPMATLIDSGRQVLLYQSSPDWSMLGVICLASLLIGALGVYLLNRFNRDYPSVLRP